MLKDLSNPYIESTIYSLIILGGVALSAFGEHFFESLRQLERENAVRRRDGYQMGRKVGN